MSKRKKVRHRTGKEQLLEAFAGLKKAAVIAYQTGAEPDELPNQVHDSSVN
jgi:hypothetical protein